MALRHEVMALGLDHAKIKGVLCPQSEEKRSSRARHVGLLAPNRACV